MPGSRHKILGHVFSGFCTKMNRCKQMNTGEEALATPLKRCLNTFDITLLDVLTLRIPPAFEQELVFEFPPELSKHKNLKIPDPSEQVLYLTGFSNIIQHLEAGVGHMVGAGIYVLTGTVAREIAGPGIILSFIMAGMTSMLAALCYAEFGTRVPKAGSAYVYTYVSVGEFWAFVIGWNIILEHMIGAASVARAWSGYVDSLLGGTISNITISVVGEMHEDLFGKYPDFLAFAVCISYACVLGMGVKGSAMVNNILTVVNLCVMALVIVLGFYYADLDNWTHENRGFLPFGVGGVVAGAATCFYAFVGFDSIATSGEEARDPGYSIPVATVLSMTLVCIGYMLVSAALTLMVPYWYISPTAALPEAFSTVGLSWAKYVVSLGALCGMTTTLLGSLFSLPRTMYSMAADGLIFSFLGKVNKTTQVPVTNLVISGLSSAIIALLFDLQKLVEFMSIGTLLAYTIVSASVIILRYRPDITPLIREDSSLSEPNTPMSGSGLTTEWRLGPGGRLKTGWSWLEPLVGRCVPGSAVSGATMLFTVFTAALCFHLHWSAEDLGQATWWTLIITAFLIATMFGCLVVIEAHEQNTASLRFKVPLVPFVPALSILCNIELMAHLNILTWLRFMTWMALGLLVYFLYGIHHSKENDTSKSYSVLLTSSEAGKIHWGAIARRKHSSDTLPIVEQEELPE